jgi:guanylate kinase
LQKPTEEQTTGLIFVLVGPGGAGKNMLLDAIKARYASISQLATATTRPKRENEVQGRERLFVSEEEFRRMIKDGELLEYQEVTPGRFYGIPRASVENKIYNGEHLIADIDMYGAEDLKKEYPDAAVLIFVTVPGETVNDKLEVLRERMTGRQETELSEKDRQRIEQRLARARTLELPFAEKCDYVVVNDDRDKAIAEMDRIIQRELKLHTQTQEQQL